MLTHRENLDMLNQQWIYIKIPLSTHSLSTNNKVCATTTWKCHFTITKVLWTWNVYKDVLINATTLDNIQENLRNIKKHKITLEDQGKTLYDHEVGSKIRM